MARGGMRNVQFIGVLAVFVFVSVFLYSSIDSSSSAVKRKAQDDMDRLQHKLDSLQSELARNDEAMNKLKAQLRESESRRKQMQQKQIEKENEIYDEKMAAKQKLEDHVDEDMEKAGEVDPDEHLKVDGQEKKEEEEGDRRGNKAAVVHNVLSRPKSLPQCSATVNYTAKGVQVQMSSVYQKLPFDNVDGGVWKQGWEVSYDSSAVQSEKELRVIVVPHSHCDPGWIYTFEEYYSRQTRAILDGMAKHLGEKKDMRFIYAEMSFLEMWWAEQTEETREKVRGYLRSGQLELVTGGWVMTDEANAHYAAMINELTEGHEWIRNEMGAFRPVSHWSIDPFGLTPTMPLLLSAANVTDAVLQRVHYSVKKHLASKKQLEFMWRQLWGGDARSDVRTHVFPFYSYDIPHTCGPDPKICCQFDFRRTPEGGKSCDWHVPPEIINKENVGRRSQMLYDQYRKKAQLYGQNVLLVSLGDDFRYDIDYEWQSQHDNYQQLFEYMNGKKEWNVKARFGTLHDYFSELSSRLNENSASLPVLSGDFFTYSDRDDHYWSGYFTSRPFYKQMDRVLAHYLRSAEIAFSLTRHLADKRQQSYEGLVQARRSHALFQHHDGITGTAKDHVVVDYGDKMLRALGQCEATVAESIQALLGTDASLSLDESRKDQATVPEKKTIDEGGWFVLFNSLAQSRREVHCVHVTGKAVRVEGSGVGRQQLSPVLRREGDGGSGGAGTVTAEKHVWELCFEATLGPFSVNTFKVVMDSDDKVERAELKGSSDPGTSDFTFSHFSSDFDISNEKVTVKFDGQTGLIKSVTPRVSGETVNVELEFVKYGARGRNPRRTGGGDDLSGAYLFLPDGPSKPVSAKANKYTVISGPLVKRVVVSGAKEAELWHTYSLSEGEEWVEVYNEVDIRSQHNFEFAMRLKTSVQSGEDAYTDLNGIQMIRRRRQLDKLPLQAHFYPMPAAAFVEDAGARVNLLGRQALGVASLESGWVEVMLDRRLNQDDGRGLFQGVLDNHRTPSTFRIFVEPLEGEAPTDATVGYLSPVAEQAANQMQYPVVTMIANKALSSSPSTFSGLSASLPCDVHAVTMRVGEEKTQYQSGGGRRVLPLQSAALVLHRSLSDCRSRLKRDGECTNSQQQMHLPSLLKGVTSVRETTLTQLYDKEKVEKVEVEQLAFKTLRVEY